MNKNGSNGFTLIELAIALMVIGLLIGGVLKGQELIQNARVTQVVRQVDSYRTAVMMFRSTYGGWPGDFRNPARVPGCTTAPCNTPGNGNGIIDPVGGAQVWSGIASARPFWNAQSENRNFWRHLYLAGIITGVSSVNGDSTPFAWGHEYPAAPIDGLGFVVGSVNWQARNGLSLVREGVDAPAMHARAAASIDRKMDDGKPNYSGDVRVTDDRYAGYAWANNCTVNATQPGEYNEGAASSGCSLYFFLD